MEPGETIGRFTIIAMLDGDAGLARDPTLGREVVVRRFDPPADAAALRREVLPATSALDGIASLHEVVRDGDAWVAVFEPVAGEPLTRWACAPGRTAREVAAVFRALAARLAALHAAGDAHGALTAASVAIDGARVTIVDHGLAALAGARPTSAQDARAFAALWQRTLAQAGLHAPSALRRALASEPPRSIASWCAAAPRRWPLFAALGALAVAGGGAWIAWPRDAAPVDAPVVALPTGPLVARPIAELGGCSSDPVFVDDGTLVFAQVGGRKDGIYALARGAAPRWVWDGPRREFALAPSGLPHKVLFYTDHIEQLDVATGAHANVVQRFNFFLNPFVIGIAPPSGTSLATPDAFYYLAQAGRSLYRSDGATARAIASLPAGEIANFDALAADGRTLTISAARGVYAIDLAAPSPALVKLPTRRVAYHRAPIAPGGQWIYYPNVDGISVFDRATGREALLVPGASAAGGLALSPDGRALVGSTCQAFGTATDTTDPRSPTLFEEALDWPVLASDGSWLYALNLPSGPIAARRLRDGRVVRLSPPELGAALTPTLSPDGLQAAFAIDGVAPGIYVAPADGSGAPRLVAPDGGHYPMWLPDGRLAFARPDAAGSIRLYALPPEGGAPVLIHPRSRRLADVMRATGEVLLVDGTFTHLWMWDPSTGDERAIALGPALDREALAIVRASPDGTRALVTTGLLNSVWRVDLRGGSPPVKLRTGELNEFAGAVYTRDGHEVIIRNAPRGALWQVDLAGR